MTSKSFNFNMIHPYAIMQFPIASCMTIRFSRIDYGMYNVLLQNTFQSSMPLLNASFGLRVSVFYETGSEESWRNLRAMAENITL